MAKLKRVGVMKMAVFLGLSTAFIGLVLGVFSTIITSLISLPSYLPAKTSLITGYWSILILPIVYGILGFLTGLVFTPINNLILRIIGGISLDIDMSEGNQQVQSTTPITQAKPAVPARKISVPKI
ncbi:MAG TPA: hypothetical protein ENG87_02370 [Candidatus Pacearchaeota archaeon]|nr:hypothetical protein BMS3Abin17_00278 [archaeon BMS3Abin17]HDK42200.1 hypothetical protein [Candidatus Pacearchaeota archaeon]HDZ60359.1 hypothetical protein [Candidatus Pacearchaeota archaeon]